MHWPCRNDWAKSRAQVLSSTEGQVCLEELSLYIAFDGVVLFYNNHLATGFI